MHKVVVCVTEIGVVRTAQHFLNLLVVYFVQTAQSVLFETEAGGPFEMFHSVILEWVFILRNKGLTWNKFSSSSADFSFNLLNQ